MKDIIFIGDGLGVRTLPAKIMGLNVLGTDISQYAIENSFCKENMIQDDIVNTKLSEQAKLVVCYDILEHLDYKDLDKAIDNTIETSQKYLLVSIPFIGDPNLLADPTHIIKENRDWWINKFESKGLKLIKTPEHFLFKEQLLIFKK